MGIAREIGKGVGKAMGPVRAGDDGLAFNQLGAVDRRTLQVTSTGFTDGGALPRDFTADGDGLAPPLTWSNVPPAARSLVVIAEDPDAPAPKPFVHWLAYGIPSSATSIIPEQRTVREGRNSLLGTSYTPASPPAGHGLHHYHFQVFALDTVIELDSGAGRTAVLDAMRNHVIAWGEIVATYERS